MVEEEVQPYDPFEKGTQKVKKRVVQREVYKTCLESGEPYTYTCQKNRDIKLLLTPEIKEEERYCPGHWVTIDTPSNPVQHDREGWWGGENVQEFCNPGCQSKSVIKQNRSVSVASEQWVGCEDMEHLDHTPQQDFSVDVTSYTEGEGATKYLDARCPTKIEQEPIYRDSWEKNYTYLITPKKCSACDVLKREGCRLVSSKCMSYIHPTPSIKICGKWERTYVCSEEEEMTDDLSDLKSANLIKPILKKSNENMYKALAQLEGLKQVSKHMEGSPIASIFKGEDLRCSINFGGAFKNCCLKDGGWGSSAGLGTKCTADEETLKKAREDKRCVYLGTRIKKKVAGVVLSKEQVHCCFPSKVARAIQEGARRQLGMNFGSVESPNCRGLTPQELERVDFGKLDLSDAFFDIYQSSQKMTQSLKRDFEQKSQSLIQKKTLDHFKKQQQEKGHIHHEKP